MAAANELWNAQLLSSNSAELAWCAFLDDGQSICVISAEDQRCVC